MKKQLLWSAILMGFISHISAATVDEYKINCNSGDIHGCYNLGLLFARGGEGVRQDIETAKAYLTLSCDEGVIDACSAMKTLTSNDESDFSEKSVDNIPVQYNVDSSNRELTRYHNDRFDFVLLYPTGLFSKKVFSDNGDGITLYNPDESLELRAYGSFYGNTIGEIYRDELKWAEESNEKVTYKVLKKNWFVLSGINDQKQTIFYQKTYFKDGKSSSFRLTYPIGDKKIYDNLVSTISKNFTIQ